MIRPIALLLATTVAVSGCSRLTDSRINPMNWFGGGSAAQSTVYAPGTAPSLIPSGATGVVDTRGLIDTITAAEIARTPSGGILRATGVAAAQGSFNAQLVRVSAEGRTATYEFRVESPSGLAVQGPQSTREVTVATTLSSRDLATYRTVVVKGARNSRNAR